MLHFHNHESFDVEAINIIAKLVLLGCANILHRMYVYGCVNIIHRENQASRKCILGDVVY